MSNEDYRMGLKQATNPDVAAVAIELSIDGKSVTAKGGVSLYDVIASTGKIIPAMCYHYTFDPFGSCGMCLVMQEGKKAPVRSCTAKAAAGMIIRTEGDDLFQARKKAVEKHLSVHPLDCPVCDADGHCELQDMAFRHGVTNLANAKQKFIPEDTRSPVLDFNMNRCIACAECINVCKDVLMIDALQFMKKGGFNQVVPKGDLALSCEFCGDCLAVCPVGAITNKFSKYLYKPWQMKKTTTTCNYCGDGCQMYEYIDSAARLKQPLLRKGNQLVETPWLETMHQVADRFSEIRRKHGPDAIAGLITARCTNEELYLFQKLMRAGFQTNHLDSSARYGHLNFVHASRHALGIGRSPNDWEDLTKANVVILIGSNITETNPLTAVRIKEAIRVYKAQVVVIDSAVTNMAKLASHPVLINPGTEGLVIDGLVKATLELDLIDEDGMKKHPQAFEALKAAVAHVSLEQVAAQTGMPVESFKNIAAIFAEASRSIILCAEGIVRQPDGYQNVLKLIDLAWVTGKLGQPGCGVNTLTEEPNEQGAVDMGAAPEFLPGQFSFNDQTARDRFAKAWDATLPAAGSGANLVEILKRCRNGQIRALYVIGENPLATLPASMEVRASLDRLELLVVQDPFLTDTARMAHAVLPACTSAEKDGTFTNLEGRVLRVREAIEPIGESLPDWHIMTALANAMGCQWEYESPNDIQAEIMKLLPGYYNLGQPRKVLPTVDRYLSNGYAIDVAARYRASAPSDSNNRRPFALLMGQVLYHSGKMSTRAHGLITIAPNTGRLRMNPQDMERLTIGEGTIVRLTSDCGTMQLAVQPDQSIAPQTCFFPEHFNEPPVKDLMSVQVDPTTGVPTFKQTRVTIEKA
jgi:predicted molibdopterin-dependent oxidoreductase YjgC